MDDLMDIHLPKLTDRVRFAMAYANGAAARLGHNAILPEHMLLGVIQDGEGVAAKALKTLDVDLPQLHECAAAQAGVALQQRQNPHADSRQILVDAKEQADLLKHDAIGTGHMLLALFKTLEPLTPQFGLHLPALRETVLELLPSDESAL